MANKERHMIDVAIHSVTKIVPKVTHYENFSTLSLTIHSTSHGTLKLLMFIDETHYDVPKHVPMDLLNKLGTAIEDPRLITKSVIEEVEFVTCPSG